MKGADGFGSSVKLKSLSVYLIKLFCGLIFLLVQLPDAKSWTNIKTLHGLRDLSISNGLSQNFVSSIQQDKFGFIWIGTNDGLNMYDGYTFKVFKHDPFNPNSISDNFIKTIYCDDKGLIWVGTLNGGLNLFDRETGKFIRFVHNPDNQNSISSNDVQAITSDSLGRIWIGTRGGGLNKIIFKDENFDTISNEHIVTRFKGNVNGITIPDADILSLITDSNGLIWVVSHQRALTISTYERESLISEVPINFTADLENTVTGVNSFSPGNRIVFEDMEGTIWLLSREGLFLYNSVNGSFQFYFREFTSGIYPNPLAATSFMGKEGKELWLSFEQKLMILNPANGQFNEIFFGNPVRGGFLGEYVNSLFADNAGAIWIGTNGSGLSVYDPYTVKFSYPDDTGYTRQGDLISSRDLSIMAMAMGHNNFLWIGANNGLFMIDRLNSVLEEIELKIDTDDGLFAITSLQIGTDGHLWMGTNVGLVKFDHLRRFVQVYPTNLIDSNQNEEPRVSEVFFTEKGDLWALTPNTIALFDQNKGTFRHKRYNDEPLNRFSEPVFPCAYEDDSGNIWLGTHNGLHYFDVAGRALKNYTNDPSDPTSLPNNNVISILPDPVEPGRYLWIATGGGGIAQFDISEEKFLSFSEKDGLSSNMVYGMLADDIGNYWLSTNHGLSKFIRDERRFINYTETDGLQSNGFNSGAFFKDLEGKLYFGGIRGYNSFFPEQIRNKSTSTPVIFTDFKFLAQNNTNQYLNISGKERINLEHKQNNFIISFAFMDFAHPNKNKFAYKFTSSGDRWIELGENRSLTFINLKPGSYTLRVKGTNHDGEWGESEAVLKISIAKPWWGRNLSLIVYGFIFLSVFLGVRKYQVTRNKLKSQLKLSSLEVNKLKGIVSMKSRFFANISHELTTPLTLIKDPVEVLIDETKDPQKEKLLEMVYANSINLQNLINQLLDLSQLESGQYNIRIAKGNIVSFTRGIVMSFASLAVQRNIKLKFIESSNLKHNESPLGFYFDHDVMEKILSYLLSNAFRFSPDGGKITLCEGLRRWRNNKMKLEIVISVTDYGMPIEKIPFINDRFFQVEGATKRKFDGSGIGLYYVRELIELHKGSIFVLSRPGIGTTFKIRFPVGRNEYSDDQIVDSFDTNTPQLQNKPSFVNIPGKILPQSVPIEASKEDKPVILIVEYHEDVRNYISYSLKKEFSVLEAADANEGIKIANEKMPDIIICDVMMPGIDGFGFCEIIKHSEKTRHIPLILLNAGAQENDRIHGLESGADDYLIQPLSSKELRLRIGNLIKNRKIMREKYHLTSVIKPGQVIVPSKDTMFMEQLLSYIEANISNEGFSVNDLASQMNMSHSNLHRKLKALINQSAIQYVKSVKMNRAKELLENNAGNIAEIAFMVGFSDPGHFTKTFKAFFGFLPSNIRKPNGNQKK